MPRLIEIDKTQEVTVIHKKCGAKIGYFLNEVKSYVHHDYGGGSDKVYYIDCPHCGEQVNVTKY